MITSKWNTFIVYLETMASSKPIVSEELRKHYEEYGVAKIDSFLNESANVTQKSDDSIPETTRFVRLNPRFDRKQSLKLLKREVANVGEVVEVPWLPDNFGFYAIPSSFSLASSESFSSGKVYGMDVSSGAAVAALLMNVFDASRKSDDSADSISNIRVLDLCCAPCLKTCAIADILEEKVSISSTVVVGVDVSEKRLQLGRNIIRKYHIDCDTSGRKDDIESSNITIRLFKTDGTTFGSTLSREKDIQSLVFDSNVAKEQQSNAGKRKRQNKSAKAREKKMLKTVSAAVFKANNEKSVDSTKDEGKSLDLCIDQFDYVLVDAECSTDGALRHLQHKVIQSTKNNVPLDDKVANNSKLTDPTKIKELVRLQKKLIESGFRLLKQGGTMIYSTCSMDQEQNENVVRSLLQEFKGQVEIVPLSFNDISENMICEGNLQGTIRFRPSTSNDLFGGGFFMAKLRRIK